MTFLLDTHVLLRWSDAAGTLRATHRQILDNIDSADPVRVSDISLWEIATLYELGRITLDLPLRDWLERATAPPRVEGVRISPAVATEVAVLPSSFHRDPADRVIVASARVLGATLLTEDTQIRESGLVATL